jgi:glycosyltransferase involved in cell wall biosynthesis
MPSNSSHAPKGSIPQGSQSPASVPLISVVTFARNEEQNLPLLYERVAQVLQGLEVNWEFLVVDDHSTDGTFEWVAEAAEKDPRVRGIRLSRNFGSHTARTCGLHHAAGDCAIGLAADLQDPPEMIPELLKKWQEGAQIVVPARANHKGGKRIEDGASRLYRWVMRSLLGAKEISAVGGSLTLMDRLVLDGFRQFRETNVSTLGLINWMGFRRAEVPYLQDARKHGASQWTLRTKIKLLIDSVTSFTFAPIRWMSYLGFAVAFTGFLYAARVVYVAFAGDPVEGWASLMVVVLIIGGAQMLMLGVLGEYLWRALSESRRRPQYLIEDTIGIKPNQLEYPRRETSR